MICINVKIGDDYPGVWVGELPGETAAGAVSQGGGVVVEQQLRAAGRHLAQREVLGGGTALRSIRGRVHPYTLSPLSLL